MDSSSSTLASVGADLFQGQVTCLLLNSHLFFSISKGLPGFSKILKEHAGQEKIRNLLCYTYAFENGR